MEYKWYKYEDKGIKDAFRLRKEVFCDEVGFTEEFEFDDSDKLALHLVVYSDTEPVGTARIIREEGDTWHFGRLCCPIKHRGKGYGKLCLSLAVDKCLKLGADRVTLGAKYDKEGFYRSRGFTSYGEIFYEEGIPHINMEKKFDKEDKMDRDLFDIPHHANLFALIYKRAVDLYGDEGRKAADEGTKLYGQQRGRRMRARAIKDGAPLTMESYLLYGEWEDKNHHSLNDPDAATYPTYTTNVLRCGWCEAWKEAGLLEYGKNYCTYVDKNLVKGFNPELKLDIERVLSQGGDTCMFLWNGFSAETDEEKQAFAQKGAKIGKRKLMDFLYHTGHLLRAMKQALAENLGRDRAEKIAGKALADYTRMYGRDMTEAVVKESAQDFTVVNY